MADALALRILSFWFGSPLLSQEIVYRDAWFRRSDAFDGEIRANFAPDVERALNGELDNMARDAQGALALILLQDQFTRNLFRATARAFAGDVRAKNVAVAALASGFDNEMSRYHKMFLYLPFEHSEDMADQDRSVDLLSTLDDPRVHDYALRHRDVIARFGRFPHRNAALGRRSTPEEIEFLKTPGSSF